MNTPFSIEAEQGAIGCCLLDPDCVDELASGVGPDGFFNPVNAQLFKLLKEVRSRNSTRPFGIDVRQAIKEKKLLDGILDGAGYLTLCENITPAPANLTFYIEILNEERDKRKTVDILSNALSEIEEGCLAGPVLSKVGEAAQSIGKKANDWTQLKDVILKVQTKYVKAKEAGGSDGIKVGFAQFDEFTGGLFVEQFSLLAARPSMGKSSMAKDFAINIAKSEIPVGVLSLEDSDEIFCARAIASQERLSLTLIREGGLTDHHEGVFAKVSADLANLPIFIDDASPQRVDAIVAKMARMKRECGCQIFFVDYIQYVDSTLGGDAARKQQVAQISKAFKSAAKRLGVHICALAQLSREAEGYKGSPPPMKTLAEASELEADADLIMFLYPGEQEGQMIDLFIHKNRNGPAQKTIHMAFERGSTHFREADHHD